MFSREEMIKGYIRKINEMSLGNMVIDPVADKGSGINLTKLGSDLEILWIEIVKHHVPLSEFYVEDPSYYKDMFIDQLKSGVWWGAASFVNPNERFLKNFNSAKELIVKYAPAGTFEAFAAGVPVEDILA